MSLSIYNTYIHPDSEKIIAKVLRSTYLSEGSITHEFEKKLQTQLGLQNPVALNSGTSALHTAMILAGVEKGDEVILPAQTFVATGLAVLYQGAKPVFADIQYETGNISAESIKKKITKRTKAIIVVHWAGYPCDLKEIHAIAREYNIRVIEDAAHALGAMYINKPIGAISDYTCFSFQAIKHITTGDGGALCCLNKKNAQKAITKRWFGIDRIRSQPSALGERRYNISEIGYKYHMNNYSAALGLANLRGFKKRLEQRRKVATIYRRELSDINGLQLFEEKKDRKSAYWIFGFHVKKRSDFIRALKTRGIDTSVVHQRIDKNSVFGKIREDLVYQKKFDATQIHIPIHDKINESNAYYITNAIKKGW